jgi:hypothetical protein
VDVGGKECHLIFIEISFEFSAFKVFINDHNSALGKPLILGVVYQKHILEDPSRHTECFW